MNRWLQRGIIWVCLLLVGMLSIQTLAVNAPNLYLLRSMVSNPVVTAARYPMVLRNLGTEQLPQNSKRLSPVGLSGQRGEPRKYLDYALAVFPGNRNLLSIRAQLRAEQGDLTNALNDLDRLESLGEQGAWLHLLRGEIFDGMGQSGSAVAEYTKGEYGPAGERALWNSLKLASDAISASEINKSKEYLQIAETLYPADLTTHYLLMDYYGATKQPVGQEQMREWLRQPAPDSIGPYAEPRMQDLTRQTIDLLYGNGIWSREMLERVRAAWYAVNKMQDYNQASPASSDTQAAQTWNLFLRRASENDVKRLGLGWVDSPVGGFWTWSPMFSGAVWNRGAIIPSYVSPCAGLKMTCIRMDGLWAENKPDLQPARGALYSPRFVWPAGRSGIIAFLYRTEELDSYEGHATMLLDVPGFVPTNQANLQDTQGIWRMAILNIKNDGTTDLSVRLYLFLFGLGRVWFGQPFVGFYETNSTYWKPGLTIE